MCGYICGKLEIELFMCVKIECIEKNNNLVKVKFKKYYEFYYNFNFNCGKLEIEFFMFCIDRIYNN